MAAGSELRAGDADRDRALDVLRAGFAEGRLTEEEHAHRVAKVQAARTYGELAELVDDLPAGPLDPAVHAPVAAGQPLPVPVTPPLNRKAVASLVCGLAMVPTLGVTALPAVMLGSSAIKEIRETGQRGESLAMVGQVLGWVAVGLFFVVILGIMIWIMLPPGPGAGGPIG
jgi:uncharacterized membrane protein